MPDGGEDPQLLSRCSLYQGSYGHLEWHFPSRLSNHSSAPKFSSSLLHTLGLHHSRRPSLALLAHRQCRTTMGEKSEYDTCT
eukprot:757112-Hanusia_phi.AAC.2